MRAAAGSPNPRRLTPAQAILWGALVVGSLDALDAIVFFGLRSRVRPSRIFQSIASGLLGPSSFQGGFATVALGVLLHYSIACGIVTTFFLLSRRLPVLTRHAVIAGLLYGPAVYVVMNYVVIPLSAARSGTPAAAVLVNGLLIHLFGVGLPSALVARAAGPGSGQAG